MGLWHRHTWEEVGRTWTGKTEHVLRGLECSEHMAERMMFGLTVIDLRCSGCGDRKSVEMLGRHVQGTASDQSTHTFEGKPRCA